MAESGSVFSRGGGGTNFEQSVQTAFLTSMIVKGNVPGIRDSCITEIALQSTRLGYQTDDLYIKCKSPIGFHRLLAQIKHEFSFTLKDMVFKDVIRQLWSDFNNVELFDIQYDKLLIIKGNLNKSEANNIISIINWAKSKSTCSDFILEIDRIKNKKETLNIFKTVIEEVDGNNISNEQLWDFCKCLELLAYDFGNHDSILYNHSLDIIKLTKDSNSRLTESEIWAQLLEFISLRNKDGGLFDLDYITQQPFYKNFQSSNIDFLSKVLEKLNRDSELILKQFSSEIQGFHINRHELEQQIVASTIENKITIVTGNPGVGKSAIVRDILNGELSASQLIVFRADQLNMPHLANVFSSIGVNDTMEDIVSSRLLHPQTIIYIDGLEKLLEGDSENAFKQLYKLSQEHSNIKILASSRRYAVDLINLKYGLDKSSSNYIGIGLLNDDELSLVTNRFPQLKPLLANQRIQSLLRSPKYIDYTLSLVLKDNSDYSNISLTKFKAKLWNYIVEDITNRQHGMPTRRGKAFLAIAVERAKNMSLFVEPANVDYEAIYSLENNNIIYKNGDEFQFSPSHDILEDWALIKYIQSNYNNNPNPQEFFFYIGNEPATRRAFRLWIEDSLIDQNESIITLIEKSIKNEEIEKYWNDEILIAIFRSDNCEFFFSKFASELLGANLDFLKRCIHIIRTTCKEGATDNPNRLMPVGSGWYHILSFISENISLLDDLRPLVSNLLGDIEYKIIWNKEDKPIPELPHIRDIIIYYINQAENQDKYWLSSSHFRTKSYEALLIILFEIVPTSKDYISGLIDRAYDFNQKDGDYNLVHFYEKVLVLCISGIYSRGVVQEFPDKICDIAWESWRYIKPKSTKSQLGFDIPIRQDINTSFGINDNLRKDFPSGIYKTPFWNMLWLHTYKAFDFILDFTNYCVENYSKSQYLVEEREIIQVEIKWKDRTITQIGSSALWRAYRGTGYAFPHIFHSLLVSLEKYLLDIASLKNERSRILLKEYFAYLLTHSRNVSISGILMSLCIAYPEEMEDCLLPLLSVKEFYEWEQQRALREIEALAVVDSDIYFAQEEMYKHNQLPHRRKYSDGLKGFIVDYQFNIRNLNKEIFELFDYLKNEEITDIYWKKTLTEIDIRNWKIGNYDKAIGGVPITPQYESDVQNLLESKKPDIDAMNLGASYSTWAYQKFKKEENVSNDFSNWEKSYSFFKNKETLNPYFDIPAATANIGLRDYKKNLSEEQIMWCVKILVGVLTILKEKSAVRYSIPNLDLSPMNWEPALRSFPDLLDLDIWTDEEKKELEILLFYCLVFPLSGGDKSHIIEDFREQLWLKHPNTAERLWRLLVSYSKFKKENKYYFDDFNQERLDLAKEKEYTYIYENIDVMLEIKNEELSFDTHYGDCLVTAVYLLPYDISEKLYKDYIYYFSSIFINALYGEFNLHEDFTRIQIEFKHQTTLGQHFSKLLIIQKSDFSNKILNHLLDVYHEKVDKDNLRNNEDMYKFILNTLEFVICNVDFFVHNTWTYRNYAKDEIIQNFWVLWSFLYERIGVNSNSHFSKLLFLDIESHGVTWDEKFKDWMPLESKEEYYKEIVLRLGASNIKPILNVFVSIGHNKLLPEGLNWLVEVLRTNPDKLPLMLCSKGERFVENIFHYYCLQIRNDKVLLKNYLWLLDNLIDLGSSSAYLVRENVITYKKVGA